MADDLVLLYQRKVCYQREDGVVDGKRVLEVVTNGAISRAAVASLKSIMVESGNVLAEDTGRNIVVLSRTRTPADMADCDLDVTSVVGFPRERLTDDDLMDFFNVIRARLLQGYVFKDPQELDGRAFVFVEKRDCERDAPFPSATGAKIKVPASALYLLRRRFDEMVDDMFTSNSQ